MPSIRITKIDKGRVLQFLKQYNLSDKDIESKIGQFIDQVEAINESDLDMSALWQKIYAIGEAIFGNKSIAKVSGYDKHEIFIHVGTKWYAIGLRISDEGERIRIFENLRHKVFGLN